jgi:hypothetical protein
VLVVGNFGFQNLFIIPLILGVGEPRSSGSLTASHKWQAVRGTFSPCWRPAIITHLTQTLGNCEHLS